MPLTEFKKKAASLALIVTTIGAGITLFGYLTPAIGYVHSISELVEIKDQLIADIDSLKNHVKEYELYRNAKKETFAVGLRGDLNSNQLIYVDERNGIYRAFLDEQDGRYFYYDAEGYPIYCYTREDVDFSDHRDSDYNQIDVTPISDPISNPIQQD